MGDGDLTGPLTALDYEELLALRWFQRNAPDEMTDAAWARYGELEEQLRRCSLQQGAMHTRRWSKGLTRRRVREIERKLNADEALTYVELQQWGAAIELSRRGNLTDDDWDNWYAEPVSRSLFDSRGEAPRMVRSRPRRITSSPRRRVRACSSTGQPGRPRLPAGDDDPHQHDLARRVAA